MPEDTARTGPIMRLFEVTVKPGRTEELLTKFASTSADVVQNEPGNTGYFFGHEVETDAERVIFASLWEDLDAVKTRFGDDWQVSFLPPGYEEMIETCSVRHIDLSAGWHVR